VRLSIVRLLDGQVLVGGKLFCLLNRARLHLAARGRRPDHRQNHAARVRELVSARRGGGGGGADLAGDDDGVDHLVLRVAHRQNVEPATPDVLGIDDRVQEPARPVRAPHDERRAVRHVRAQVRDHPGLLLGRHAHERRQEHDVVRAELPRQGGHVGGVERHARAEALVGAAEQPPRPLVGRAAPVVVVEHRVRQVVRGEHEGAERQRARPDEGDAGGSNAGDVADEEVVLQLAQVDVVAVVREAGEVVERVDVVAVVREAGEVVERVVEGGEHVGVVRLEVALAGGAEADELLPHRLRLRAELGHVDGARRDARRDEVGEERVHLGGWAQRRQLGDGGVEAGDLLDQGSDLLVLSLHL
uniref:Uncharacterized protein n=1 Tax=Oryza meridionalis TaxID=40149 RepID=A0A0E0CZI2_9ORYZ